MYVLSNRSGLCAIDDRRVCNFSALSTTSYPLDLMFYASCSASDHKFSVLLVSFAHSALSRASFLICLPLACTSCLTPQQLSNK